MTTTLTKGGATRETVLRAALADATRVGLRGITIGGLATTTGMSKSGLFAHFGSKEELQVSVMQFAADHFATTVIAPALREERGEPRIREFFDRWLTWASDSPNSLPGGCIFVAVASEYDDEPDGPVRDSIVAHETAFLDTLGRIFRSGITAGHFADDIDPDAAGHELLNLMLGYTFSSRLMRDPASRDRAKASLEDLLARLRA